MTIQGIALLFYHHYVCFEKENIISDKTY